jgi:hypothetical protein
LLQFCRLLLEHAVEFGECLPGDERQRRRIEQDQAGDQVRVAVGEHLHVQAAERVPHEQVRPSDAGVFEQLLQLFGGSLAVTRQWPGLARTVAGAVIRAHARDLRDLGLEGLPALRRIANARIDDHDRAAFAHAPNVQAVCANVDYFVHLGSVSSAARRKSQQGQ